MLFEQHKSNLRPEPFGIVIENNTSKKKFVEFLGHDGMFKRYDEGISVYPMYKDLYFDSVDMILNWLMTIGGVIVEITKFQSSVTYDPHKKYYFHTTEVYATGEQWVRNHLLKSEDDLPSHVRELKEEMIVSYNHKFGYEVDKFSHIAIKFIPKAKKQLLSGKLFGGTPPSQYYNGGMIKKDEPLGEPISNKEYAKAHPEEDYFYSEIKNKFGNYSEEKKKKLLLII